MLVTVIAEKNYADAKKQIKRVIKSTDAIELRLDYFANLIISDIRELKKAFSIPMIFTLRKYSQGGVFTQPEIQRLRLIDELAQLEPEFIDLEYDVPIDFALTLKANYPTIQLIRSYHDFVQTPDNLTELLSNLRHEVYSIYKIVTFATSTLDCLKMLNFVKNIDSNDKITGFCMGDLGIPSRLLGPIVGNVLHYTCVDDKAQAASGQLSLTTMLDLYRFRSINADTNIYALLGDPVDHSAGHIVHNRVFNFLNKQAIYVKLNLKSTELKDFFKLIKSLPFKGFSVTMPLKQDVMPYLHQIENRALAVKSVNTIVISDNGKLMGYNTDAQAALDAIEDKILVTNKIVVIIGTGSSGRAIGQEAIQRNATVIFLNRTAQKAYDLASKMNCLGYGIDEITSIKTMDYDILINTTPLGMSGQNDILPLPEECLIPQRVVMDIVYNPVHTLLLKKAHELNCTRVFGYEMFINQAVLQLQLWLGKFSNLKEIQHVCLEEFITKVLFPSEES